jgi:hypothetical protein
MLKVRGITTENYVLSCNNDKIIKLDKFRIMRAEIAALSKYCGVSWNNDSVYSVAAYGVIKWWDFCEKN